MTKRTNPLTRILRSSWGFIDAARRTVVNLLFLAIVVVLLVMAFSSDEPEIADTAALVVAPKGQLVEQLSAKTFDRIIDEASGQATPETLLKDVVDAIEAAGDDDRIKVLVLNLNSFNGARLTKLQDAAEAIVSFRNSGKKVVAMADQYTQDAYYLAAHADEIITHEMGAVVLEGYGRYRMYYKEGIDKLGLDVHIFKVGTYKSAVEPFLRNDMWPLPGGPRPNGSVNTRTNFPG